MAGFFVVHATHAMSAAASHPARHAAGHVRARVVTWRRYFFRTGLGPWGFTKLSAALVFTSSYTPMRWFR